MTKPVQTYLRGKSCPVDGRPVPLSKTKPRAVCSDNCKTILHRLKRRQGEACTHSQHGMGTYRVSPGVDNAAIWFTSNAKGGPFVVLGADLTFVKNRQPRDNRRKTKAFARDHWAAESHDPAFMAPLRTNGLGKNKLVGHLKGAQSFVKTFGTRSKGGRFIKHRDYSTAIEVFLASQFFKKKGSNYEQARAADSQSSSPTP